MYEKIDKLIIKIINNIVIAALIFVIGLVFSGVILYNALDFKYATEKDFQPLYQIQDSIINDFDAVYTFDNIAIDLTDSNIIVSIYGDDCYLKTYFDKTKTYQTTKEIDTTEPLLFSIIIFVLTTFIGAIVFYLLFLVLLLIIDALMCKLIKLKKIL